MRTTFRWTIIVGLFIGVSAGCRREAEKPTGLTAGEEQARRVEVLKTLDAEGRVTLIEFGWIGCPLSGKGFDEMIRMARDNAIEGLAYARVETGGDPAAVEAYRKETDPPFAMVHDPDMAIAKTFDAMATPTFVLADKFGHVRYRGRFPGPALGEWVEVLVAETDDPGENATLFGAVKLDGPKLLAATRLPELKGPVRPLADYVGVGGLVIVFVDTACPYSGEAIDDLPSVAAELAARKIPTVAVNLDDAEQLVSEFYAGKDLGVPVVYDTSTATKLSWNIQSVPTVVYLNADGEIRYNGKALWADLAVAVEARLKKDKGTISFDPTGTGFG